MGEGISPPVLNMLNWFLIYTKPRCEDTVSCKFVEKGFSVLNLKIKERRYIRRKLQDSISPLFPCYLFVQFDVLRDYRLIRYTRGVKNVVGIENIPSIVPMGIINELKKRTSDGFVNITPKKFSPGSEVVIKAGPFEGINAVFEKELKGPERVAILLKALNVRVIVDSAILDRI